MIDAVVFSPPFAEANRGGGIAVRGYDGPSRKGHEDIHLHLDRPLSDAPDNISNMPYGAVDAIVTSLPYTNRSDGGRIAKEGVGGFGHYSGEEAGAWFTQRNPKNVGNLPHGQVDAVVTSPLYEGALESTSRHTKGGIPERDARLGETGLYGGEHRDNIGNLKSDTYLGAMLQVYRECFKVLKPGGVMVLITKNFIRQKKIVRLDLDTIKLCEVAGFVFVERWYRHLEHPSFWRIIYAKKFNYCPRCLGVYRVRNKTSDKPTMTKCSKCPAGPHGEVQLLPALIPHEDILVFRKGV